jgi:hypothetical protein
MDKPVVFAGPSLFGLNLEPGIVQSIDIRPPAKRGNIAELFASGSEKPRVIIIADGVFRSEPAVGHREILRAIQTGCQVWGVSSMGAIRAYELRFYGMLGFGCVYNDFLKYNDFTDDEVALLHSPIPPYKPFSEALVNIRHFFEEDPLTGILHPDAIPAIIQKLKSMYFGARTLSVFQDLLTSIGQLKASDAVAFIERNSNRRIKSKDLISILRLKPWTQTQLS